MQGGSRGGETVTRDFDFRVRGWLVVGNIIFFKNIKHLTWHTHSDPAVIITVAALLHQRAVAFEREVVDHCDRPVNSDGLQAGEEAFGHSAQAISTRSHT